MAEQHQIAESEKQRINDYLSSFKSTDPASPVTASNAEDPLEDYLLERAALALSRLRESAGQPIRFGG